jgi:integrase
MKKWTSPIYKGAYCFKRPDSKYVYLSVGARRKSTGILWSENNKREALDALNDYYYEIYEPKKQAKDYTLYDALKLFLSELKNNIIQETLYRYIFIFKKVFPENIPLDNPIFLKETLFNNFNAFYANKANNTKYKAIQRLQKFFNYCVDCEFINKNPISKRMLPKQEVREIKTFTDTQIISIATFLFNNDIRLYYYFQIALMTGFRLNEIVQLEWSNITEISINLDKTKTKQPREFPLKSFPELSSIFLKLKELNKEKPCHYTNRVGFSRAFTRVLKKLNIEGLSFHNIRKTFVNKLQEFGVNDKVAANIAGHSQKVADKYYRKKLNVEYLNNYFETLGKN